MLYSTIEEAWSRNTLEGFQGTQTIDNECEELIKKVLQCSGCSDKLRTVLGVPTKVSEDDIVKYTVRLVDKYVLKKGIKEKLEMLLMFCALVLVILILASV